MRKRVLIVASVISFIEWFNKENIDALKHNMDCDVHIACNFSYFSDTDEERTRLYIDKLKNNGIILHDICFNRNPLGKNNVAAYRSLKKLIETSDFDLVHCHTPVASVLTRLAARKKRKNGMTVMYTCHGFHFHNAAPKKNWIVYYPVERFLSRYCDYLITINKEDYYRAQSFHTKNVRYIPGVGVDIKKIKQTVVNRTQKRESIHVPVDSIMLLSVGELIERKNHEVIIHALSRINNKKIHYVICGKGELLEYLETLARNLGVDDRITFLGFRTDIPELCAAADIFAFPSKIEGLGIAGIEAMAAGLPLVSSNVHGILDYVVDGKTGYVCAPTDVEAFASAIERLAANKELRESMKDACQKAIEPFEISNAHNAMLNIYGEILG